MVLFCTYAPTQTPKYPIDVRQSYFEELSHFYASVSCNGPKIISGDLNSRLYMRFPAEEDIVGSNIVEQPDRHFGMDLNRFLLLELCAELRLQIQNTFLVGDLHDLVSYREVWYRNGQQIARNNYELLDLLFWCLNHVLINFKYCLRSKILHLRVIII